MSAVPAEPDGVLLKNLIRRLWVSDSGAALVEHSLLIALIAIGLLVVLARFADGVGGATKRSASTVSTRVYGGGYGQPGGGPGATTYEDRPSTPQPDSTASEPDSSLAGEGGSAAARGLGGY